MMLDMHPEQDILDALADGVVDDLERLQKLLVRSPHGVHVLPPRWLLTRPARSTAARSASC